MIRGTRIAGHGDFWQAQSAGHPSGPKHLVAFARINETGGKTGGRKNVASAEGLSHSAGALGGEVAEWFNAHAWKA